MRNKTINYGAIFAANVKASMEAENPRLSQTGLANKANMQQRTLGRIINEENSPTLEQMSKIAGGLDRDLWQLLVPNMNPLSPPELAAPTSEKERELWNTIQRAAQDLARYTKVRS